MPHGWKSVVYLSPCVVLLQAVSRLSDREPYPKGAGDFDRELCENRGLHESLLRPCQSSSRMSDAFQVECAVVVAGVYDTGAIS